MSDETNVYVIYSRYIRNLPASERATLIALIANGLVYDVPSAPPERHSILELEGLGEEIWEGIDAQEYVDALRDGRPFPGDTAQ